MNDIPEKRGYKVAWITCALVAMALVIGGVTLAFTLTGNSTSQSVVTQGKHRDCITTLATARNAVFQNVDIYKAIEIQLLSGALLDSSNNVTRTPAERDALKATYQMNDDLLKTSLVEARRLQPAKTLDNLIDHGGIIDGVRYPPCPG